MLKYYKNYWNSKNDYENNEKPKSRRYLRNKFAKSNDATYLEVGNIY